MIYSTYIYALIRIMHINNELTLEEVFLGPVYTTVEKSTGHEKKGVSQL